MSYKNPADKKRYDKEYGLSHKAERKKRDASNVVSIRKNRVDWAKNNPEKVRDMKYKRNYKITLEQYEEIYRKQGGVCAVCFERETMKYLGKVRELCVDHDHNTGKVRGLLCSNCNRALGLLQDSLLVCHSLMDYLITNGKTI